MYLSPTAVSPSQVSVLQKKDAPMGFFRYRLKTRFQSRTKNNAYILVRLFYRHNWPTESINYFTLCLSIIQTLSQGLSRTLLTFGAGRKMITDYLGK